jgi:GGDEF domain-containing protein
MKAPGISIPLTVSIDLFYVHKECIYTEREIETFANQATTTAKNDGKNRIEVFEDKSIPASQ